MSTLLIIVIGIIAACGLAGYWKGFILSAFSMIMLVLTFVIAINTYTFASKAILKTNLNENISEHVQKLVGKVTESDTDQRKPMTVSQQTSVIEDLPLPDKMKSAIKENNNDEIYKVLNVRKFDDYLASYITMIIINAIGFIVVFVLAGVVLGISAYFLNILSKLPVLNGINKIGGLLLGALQGIIVVWLLCIVVTAFGGTEWSQNILGDIQRNSTLSFIYDHNYLLHLIVNMSKVLF